MAAGTLGCFDGFKGWMGQGAQARQHSRSLDASPSKKSTPSAKVALQQLPEWPGCGEELRGFWAVFAKMDLQPLTAVQQWDLREEQALDYIQQRCLRAVHPFILAMQILEEQWTVVAEVAYRSGKKGRGAEAVANRSHEWWNLLLLVQRLLGRLGETPPWFREIDKVLVPWRDKYLSHCRSFQLIGVILHQCWEECSNKKPMSENCRAKASALVTVQRTLPEEWKQRNAPASTGSSDVAGATPSQTEQTRILGTCWARRTGGS
mmetsp:Transcript_56324/g.126689  ORF Transcript_56324/g.126689 Transcript_56324/m.126689 type:complete len:263 (-) Transcript_56324:19-807(-)